MAYNFACPRCGTRNKHSRLSECVESLKIEVRSLRRHYQEIPEAEKKAVEKAFSVRGLNSLPTKDLRLLAKTIEDLLAKRL